MIKNQLRIHGKGQLESWLRGMSFNYQRDLEHLAGRVVFYYPGALSSSDRDIEGEVITFIIEHPDFRGYEKSGKWTVHRAKLDRVGVPYHPLEMDDNLFDIDI